MKPLKSFFISLSALFAFLPASWGQPYKDSGMVRLKEVNDSIKEAMYYMALDSGPDVVHLYIAGTANGHAVVYVHINNYAYRFVFDTGCSRSMINSRRVPAEPDDSVFLFGKMSGGSGVQKYEGIVKVDSIKLGKWKSGEYLLPMKDMGDPNGYYGIDGILGMRQLEGYDILFDWRDRLITLCKPYATDSVVSARYDISTSVPIIVSKDPFGFFIEPEIRSRFKSRQYKLILDTGSPFCLIPYEARPWLLNILPAKMKGLGTGEPVKVRFGHLRYKLGDKKFRHVITFLLPDEFYTEIDDRLGLRGMLGMNVLRRGPFLISVRDSRLVLLKAKK